jgi:transcriptional/translational regulatory protein YebC/TACO1
VDVYTAPDDYESVKQSMEQHSLVPDAAEVTMHASTNTPLGEEDAQKMVRLLEILEDLDDVQNVYSNADISEEILAQIA